MHWHAARSDDFRPPIVRGMGKPKQARERVLEDGELRIVWKAAGAVSGPVGHLVRFLLLTATRLREAAWMVRGELALTEDGGAWTIPASRCKGKRDLLLPLSRDARDVLANVPMIGRKGIVFTRDGEKLMTAFAHAKVAIDKAVLAELRKTDPQAKPLPRWCFHDLRRTARSLMSRAGVPSRYAEMALGHTIPGVEGAYDRHSYREEKLAAFEALATVVAGIVAAKAPPSTVQMPAAADRVLAGTEGEPVHA
jgi:integrase